MLQNDRACGRQQLVLERALIARGRASVTDGRVRIARLRRPRNEEQEASCDTVVELELLSALRALL